MLTLRTLAIVTIGGWAVRGSAIKRCAGVR
jgi:hypothetical protein